MQVVLFLDHIPLLLNQVAKIFLQSMDRMNLHNYKSSCVLQHVCCQAVVIYLNNNESNVQPSNPS